MSQFIYYFRPSQSEVDNDMMRQRFVDEVYRPCNRLSKKSCCQRFNSRCLQCCVEHEFTAGGGAPTSTKRLLDIFR